MKLELHCINKVREANITLNGLTVIAGENGSGKSTVGKMLFSMIKSVINAEAAQGQSTEKRIRRAVNALYNRVRLSFNRYSDEQIDHLFPLPYTIMVDRLQSMSDDSESIQVYLDEILSELNNMDITPRLKSKFVDDIDNIRIAMTNNRAADVAVQVRSFVESEFMGRICSLKQDSAESILEMDSENESLTLRFKNDRISEVKHTCSEFLKDATYIESPLYMHILDTLLKADTYKEYQIRRSRIIHGMVPIHVKDLAEKIDALQMVSPSLFDDSSIDISSIIGGQFLFERDNHRLVFYDTKNNSNYSPINIASGIKTFGLIQILQKIGLINSDNLLIWDEPENHLHPKWQVAFAEVLVLLAKQGTPILVSTHSPFFVQGIRYYSAKYQLEKYTNYYLAEEQEDGLSVFNDVSTNLNAIFSKLAEPLNHIMNVDLVRKESKEE